MNSEHIPIWHRDRLSACDRIRDHRGFLKILLKTKDEPGRLGNWIEHHANIVGSENLIIFDNMSTDQEVLDIYAHYNSSFPIVSFSQFQDLVHHVDYFGELYEALRESSTYYVFLDTDEYLTLYDGFDRFLQNAEILTFLDQVRGTDIIPGTWLQNLRGYKDRFVLREPNIHLRLGLKWGKPIISSNYKPAGMINHNTQIKAGFSPDKLKTNLFILHRCYTTSSERIQMNLRKLRASEIIGNTEGLEEVLALDFGAATHGQKYIREIRSLVEARDTLPSSVGSFEIGVDGLVSWDQEWQRSEMQEFIRNPSRFCDELFSE
jgi:hypothetical protein